MLYKHIILSGQSIPDPVQMQHCDAKHSLGMSSLWVALTAPPSDTRDLRIHLIWLNLWQQGKLLAVAPPQMSLVEVASLNLCVQDNL